MNFVWFLYVWNKILRILPCCLIILPHIFCFYEICICKRIHLSISFHLRWSNWRRVTFSWILNCFCIITFSFVIRSLWYFWFEIISISNMCLLRKLLRRKISKLFFTKIHCFWRCMEHTRFREIMRFSMVICKLFDSIRRKYN